MPGQLTNAWKVTLTVPGRHPVTFGTTVTVGQGRAGALELLDDEEEEDEDEEELDDGQGTWVRLELV